MKCHAPVLGAVSSLDLSLANQPQLLELSTLLTDSVQYVQLFWTDRALGALLSLLREDRECFLHDLHEFID
jgi:hypothetical protein